MKPRESVTAISCELLKSSDNDNGNNLLQGGIEVPDAHVSVLSLLEYATADT